MVESVDAYSWGQKLGTILQNGIVFGYSFLTTFDWNGLGAKLAGFVNGLLDKVDGAQLGALFAAKFTIAIRTLGTFLANLDWATLGTQLSNFAAGISLGACGRFTICGLERYRHRHCNNVDDHRLGRGDLCGV